MAAVSLPLSLREGYYELELEGNEIKSVDVFTRFLEKGAPKFVGKIKDVDDSAIRDELLYGTPYYVKGIIDDKVYFDKYWEGGYEVFLEGIGKRNAK